MIHGFRGTHHGLLLIAKYFRKDYNVIIPDIPGFANGDRLPNYSLDSYVKWLERFIKKQSPEEKPILLGHSFGSIICSAYASKHPRSLEKLILVNPIGAPALEGQNKLLTRLALLYYGIGKKLPENMAKNWLSLKPIVFIISLSMIKTKDKNLRKFIHDQHYSYFSLFHSAESVAQGFSTSVNHNVGDFAQSIQTPTLLVAAALDEITDLSHQYALVKKFKNGTLSVIDNVGHLTHYETPDKVSRIIKRWLARENSATKKMAQSSRAKRIIRNRI